jgi:hypothetical protein
VREVLAVLGPSETCEMNVGVCLCARFGHAHA